MIFFGDPSDSPAIPGEILRMLFQLTPAEGRLALAVFAGNTLAEAAELNQVSRETVKSQLTSIFQKTGTRRQGELIRLMARLHG